MLSKRELITLLVAWSRMNDTALADDDVGLVDHVCSRKDRAAVRRAAHLVDHLRKGFSYVESPRFRRGQAGKTIAYASVRGRLEDAPARRVQHLRSFDTALELLLVSKDAYDLTSVERHADLDALASILRQVGNPDSGTDGTCAEEKRAAEQGDEADER